MFSSNCYIECHYYVILYLCMTFNSATYMFYTHIYMFIIVCCLFFDGWHLTWKKNILLLYNIMICYMILCVMYIWLCEIICYDIVSVLCADYYFINGLEPPPEFDHLGLQVLNNRLSYQNRRLVGRLPGFIRDGDRGSIYRYTWCHMIFFSLWLSACMPEGCLHQCDTHHSHHIYIHCIYTFQVYMYIYIHICICQCLTIFQIIPIQIIYVNVYLYAYIYIDMWS